MNGRLSAGTILQPDALLCFDIVTGDERNPPAAREVELVENRFAVGTPLFVVGEASFHLKMLRNYFGLIRNITSVRCFV